MAHLDVAVGKQLKCLVIGLVCGLAAGVLLPVEHDKKVRRQHKNSESHFNKSHWHFNRFPFRTICAVDVLHYWGGRPSAPSSAIHRPTSC